MPLKSKEGNLLFRSPVLKKQKESFLQEKIIALPSYAQKILLSNGELILQDKNGSIFRAKDYGIKQNIHWQKKAEQDPASLLLVSENMLVWEDEKGIMIENLESSEKKTFFVSLPTHNPGSKIIGGHICLDTLYLLLGDEKEGSAFLAVTNFDSSDKWKVCEKISEKQEISLVNKGYTTLILSRSFKREKPQAELLVLNEIGRFAPSFTIESELQEIVKTPEATSWSQLLVCGRNPRNLGYIRQRNDSRFTTERAVELVAKNLIEHKDVYRLSLKNDDVFLQLESSDSQIVLLGKKSVSILKRGDRDDFFEEIHPLQKSYSKMFIENDNAILWNQGEDECLLLRRKG